MAKRRLFGIEIDSLTLRQSVERIVSWTRASDRDCKYVVTPNVDHAVLLDRHAGLRGAYSAAALTLADGYPIVWASRWLGQALPERVTGSDLVPSLFGAALPDKPLTVFLLGAAPGVADRAARSIESKWPAVSIVGCYSPPLGFERNATENRKILDLINERQPDVLILGLGAPKQECWIHEFHKQLRVKVAICAGATIDFLAGQKRRAPIWMQRMGLEWFFRMCSEPRRLIKRYAYDAWVFPRLLWRQWRSARPV